MYKIVTSKTKGITFSSKLSSVNREVIIDFLKDIFNDMSFEWHKKVKIKCLYKIRFNTEEPDDFLTSIEFINSNKTVFSVHSYSALLNLAVDYKYKKFTNSNLWTKSYNAVFEFAINKTYSNPMRFDRETANILVDLFNFCSEQKFSIWEGKDYILPNSKPYYCLHAVINGENFALTSILIRYNTLTIHKFDKYYNIDNSMCSKFERIANLRKKLIAFEKRGDVYLALLSHANLNLP